MIDYFEVETLNEAFQTEKDWPIMANEAMGTYLIMENCDWKEVDEYVSIFNTILFSNTISEDWRRALSISVVDNMLYQPVKSEDLIDWNDLLSDQDSYCNIDRNYFEAFQLTLMEMGSLWLLYPFSIFLAGVVMLVLKNNARLDRKKEAFYFEGFRATVDTKITGNLGNSFILFTKISENIISSFYVPIISLKFKKLSLFIANEHPRFREKLEKCRSNAIKTSRKGKKVRKEMLRTVLAYSRFMTTKRKKAMKSPRRQIEKIGRAKRMKTIKLEKEKASLEDTFFEELNKDVISALLRLSDITNFEYRPKLRSYLINDGHKVSTIIEIPLKKRIIRISKEYYMKEWMHRLFSCEKFWNRINKEHLVSTARQSRKRHKAIEEIFLRDELPLKLKVLALLNQVIRFEKTLKIKEEKRKSIKFVVARIDAVNKKGDFHKNRSISWTKEFENQETLARHIYETDYSNERPSCSDYPSPGFMRTFNNK